MEKEFGDLYLHVVDRLSRKAKSMKTSELILRVIIDICNQGKKIKFVSVSFLVRGIQLKRTSGFLSRSPFSVDEAVNLTLLIYIYTLLLGNIRPFIIGILPTISKTGHKIHT